MTGGMRAPAPHLLHWLAPHPEWRPRPIAEGGGWGPLVGSAAIRAGDVLVLVDPLLPPPGAERDAVLARLDDEAAAASGGVAIVLTIAYHARSSAELAARYGASDEPPEGVERLPLGDPLNDAAVHVPACSALVVGDLVLGSDAIAGEGPPGGLRLCPAGWLPDTAEAQAWHATEAPRAAARLAALAPAHVLVTHGTPVIGTGARALAALAG